jgi:two-component system NtrC family response regulator
LSSRADRPLTMVDCAALPPSLVESILFGHLKGSFTGADKARHGLVAQADGGTLFLDEISEIPPAVQKKLLRVIQERSYLPVGSTTERTSDFRLIAATNRDLHEMANEGAFREDLLYRLKTFYLELPPLRVRLSDINELAYYYRDQFCKQQKLKRKKFSSEFLLVLKQYEWPGNVRELFQAIERSISEALDSNILYPIHLPPEIRIKVIQSGLADNDEETRNARGDDALDAVLESNPPTLKAAREAAIDDCEKEYLSRLLDRTHGDIKECCSIAGLSRSRFYDLLKKHDLGQHKSATSGDEGKKTD